MSEPIGPRDRAGYELPLVLLAGFRTLIDQLHAELARQGHPGVRPAHGFAMQAIGQQGTTASELGRRLGITKQAAGKTVGRLERLGYVERLGDESDARRRLVRLSPRGIDVLVRSAAIFEDLRARWVDELGAKRVADLEADLRSVVATGSFRLDVASWLDA